MVSMRARGAGLAGEVRVAIGFLGEKVTGCFVARIIHHEGGFPLVGLFYGRRWRLVVRFLRHEGCFWVLVVVFFGEWPLVVRIFRHESRFFPCGGFRLLLWRLVVRFLRHEAAISSDGNPPHAPGPFGVSVRSH